VCSGDVSTSGGDDDSSSLTVCSPILTDSLCVEFKVLLLDDELIFFRIFLGERELVHVQKLRGVH
jgi:hypothetical protein